MGGDISLTKHDARRFLFVWNILFVVCHRLFCSAVLQMLSVEQDCQTLCRELFNAHIPTMEEHCSSVAASQPRQS